MIKNTKAVSKSTTGASADNDQSQVRRSFPVKGSSASILLIVFLLVIREFVSFSPQKMFLLLQTESGESFYNSLVASTILDETPFSDNESIRKWGCHRTETPLIFVHIGKAGGGEIRERLARAAEDVNRSQWHQPGDDEHYYPIAIGNSTSFRRGKFCNSKNKNYMIPRNNRTVRLTDRKKSFEGDVFCNATTPFGIAIACPGPGRGRALQVYSPSLCMGCNDEYYLEHQYYKGLDEDQKAKTSGLLINPPDPSDTCDTVYVGHNLMGTELGWLPPRYLKKYWWDNSPWKKNGDSNVNELERFWESLMSDRKPRAKQVLEKLNNESLSRLYAEATKDDDDNNSPKWCPNGYSGHGSKELQYHREGYHNDEWHKQESRFNNCIYPIGEAVDGLFRGFWNKHHQKRSSTYTDDNNYSPIYASLPLHRITMLREPFSWLISKFFWDRKVYLSHSCEDIFFSSHENPTMSWIELYSLQYLTQLCGPDCEARLENDMMSLEGIVAQAESNLRNAFSVVGLLHESDSFYDMIHKRIDYIDFNKTIEIDEFSRHPSVNMKEKPKCKELFLEDEEFRNKIRSSSPALSALERVYNVGVEVNRFQREELEQCS